MRNLRKIVILSFFVILALVGSSCGSNNQTPSRTFYLGFSPWPYDNTQEAVDWVYAEISANGDAISQHMEEGVPWPEAYSPLSNPTPFSQDYINTIYYRVQHSAGKKIILQINPLNTSRDGIALYRGSSIMQPLPTGWESVALNSEQVKTAYLNYAIRMKEYFNPTFMLLGIEVNILIDKNPTLWPAYIELHRYVYTELKKLYPTLPLGVSVFCVPYFPKWTTPSNLTAQLNGLNDLAPYIDFLAFSVHPFMSSLLAEIFPEDYFRRLFAITSKPIAISESSYPAQEWTTLTEPFLTFRGTPEKQAQFLSLMLAESQRVKAKFVIWYSIRDYDALWNTFSPDLQALGITWRDTGLYDESGNERKAMGVWKDWYSRPRAAD
ncbi:MAG TPA: hypothetical protein VHY08_21450 [Bacillota bacterium]|nr:hypothetical protein [Bacillota bacterium]